MNVTYAITVCNELTELTELINFLPLYIKHDDEILIQYDETSVTSEVADYIKIMVKMHHNVVITGFPLNGDFSSFKNNLKKHATKDYIFQLDADEIPSQLLLENLNDVLETNPVDLIFVPRINTVEGLTPEHIRKWGWMVNDLGHVNFPDYQTRIYKNTEDIMWMNKVHERITGYNTFSNFPAEEEWCMYHAKTINKQESQNAFYETI
jgi:glycosyltransferase involved in cell wall biosynthesis